MWRLFSFVFVMPMFAGIGAGAVTVAPTSDNYLVTLENMDSRTATDLDFEITGGSQRIGSCTPASGVFENCFVSGSGLKGYFDLPAGFSGAGTGVAPGDTINLRLAGFSGATFEIQFSYDTPPYNVDPLLSFTPSPNTVSVIATPLPAGFPLLLAALAGLVFKARQKHKSA